MSHSRLSPGIAPRGRIAIVILFTIWTMCGLSYPGESHAMQPVPLTEETNSVILGPYADYLEDKTGTLTIWDVSSPGYDMQFVGEVDDSLNVGFTRSAYWLRFELSNASADKREAILEIGFPLIDRVDLYTPYRSGVYVKQSSGLAVPLSQRGLKFRRPVFSLSIPPASSQIVYVRFQDSASVPLSVRLWTPTSFASHAEFEGGVQGLYYGAMVIILLFNLLMYISTGSRSYLYYVFYVLSFVLWQMTYNGFMNWLTGDYSLIVNYAVPVFICTTGVAAIQFSRIFLDTRQATPRADVFMRALLAGFALGIVIAVQPNHTVSILYAATVGGFFAPTVLTTGLIAWAGGLRSARFFTVAWFMLLVGTALLSLKSFGILPSNLFTEYGQQMGSFVEIILLSVALGDQINGMRKDKERAQTEILQAQHIANQQLEDEVRERTRELLESNQQLTVLSSKLAKYLSPQVYDSIFQGKTDVVRHPSRKRLSVFFSDIRGFTELTDRMEPEELTDSLNAYLSDMAGIGLRFGGTIDKFLGDAIMIFFGDPESNGLEKDALSCVMMALAMRDRIRQAQINPSEGYGPKPFSVRMGISTGYCTVGNFGAENRMDYTIIGGAVNLASRLQTAADPGQVLISHETYILVKEYVLCTDLGELRLKGMAYPIKAYDVTGLRESNRSDRFSVRGDGFVARINPSKFSEKDRRRIREILRLTSGGPDQPEPRY